MGKEIWQLSRHLNAEVLSCYDAKLNILLKKLKIPFKLSKPISRKYLFSFQPSEDMLEKIQAGDGDCGFT
jgi:hypothetical protein